MTPTRPTVSQKYIPFNEKGPYMSYSQRGYPYRQGPMPLKVREMEDTRYSADFGGRGFDLGNADDLKAYVEVMDKIFNKRFRLVGPIPQPFWDEEGKTWRVFVQWLDIHAEVPPYVLRLLGMTGRR